MNPSLVTAKRHGQVNFLDLHMSLQRSVMARTGATITVLFLPYRKQGNSYADILFTSFHGHHTCRGWMLAELLRLLTHSSTPELWKEEGSIFYHPCSRGYQQSFLKTFFQEVTWARRSQLLAQSRKRNHNEFFETYQLTKPVFSPSGTHRSSLR